MNFSKALIFISILVFNFACSTLAPPLTHTLTCKEAYYSLRTSQCLSEEEALEYIKAYKIIFIGDHHDEKALHVKIASMIRLLEAKGYKVHIANEWFTPSDNAILASYKDSDINASMLQVDTNWSKNVGYDFASYKKIYESNVSLYGINLSRTFRKKISDANVSAMDASELKFFQALDLTTSLHVKLVKPYMSHCKMIYKLSNEQDACEKRMYRVQVAWDSYMAKETYRLSKHLLQEDKDRLIIIAGSMHLAYNAGINMRFSRLSHLPTFTLLPIDSNETTVDLGYADMLLRYSSSKESR